MFFRSFSYLFCVSLLFCIENHFVKCVDTEDGELIFVHTLFRHGDRTPIDPYPTDPHRNTSEWETGFGQLTNIGKQQHYELGQWLRKRYSNFISPLYSKQNFFVQSTDVDRTLMSALSNLAGLFPPTGKQIWNQNINWQPIPIHTVPEKMDSMLAAKKPCASYEFYMGKLKRSEEYQNINRKLKWLYDYLTEHTGRPVSSMEGVQNIYNCLFIERLYNKTLPDWTNSVFPDKMKWISSRSFATAAYTQQLARLKVGPLLKDILERFQKKSKGKLHTDRSMYIYSGHDTTIANLLNILGLFEYHSPPYAACIMLELRKINGSPFVSIYYRNTTEEPIAMNIPNCGQSCPLKKMFELYKNVLPIDWENECQISMLAMTYEEADLQPALIVVLIGALSTLIILIIFGAMTIYRRRDYQDARWYLHVDS